MMARWKRALATVSACAMSAGVLASCDTGESSGEGKSVELLVWSDQGDMKTEDSWLPTVQREFEKQHPEYDITWTNEVVASANAASNAKQDPTVAADVYAFPSDQLGTLIESGALGRTSDESLKQLKKQSIGNETMVQSVTAADGHVYGMPFRGNTWFMYYRKSKFASEDIKSLDALLEKGKVAFQMTNAWYLPGFYVGAGGTVFGPDGIDAGAGIDFGGATGEAVTKYLVNLRDNPNFVNDKNGSGLAGMKDGKIDVIFSGAWDAEAVAENTGGDWGAAQLPSYELDGKQVQMKSFAGSTAYGWNPYTKYPEVADQFVAFMASSWSQQVNYEKQQVIPADSSLMSDPAIGKDPAAVAQMNAISKSSIVQSSIPQMANFWVPCENFGNAIYNREVTLENASEKLERWMASYKQLL
ncbi:MAG: ABC transporter substrate-binding protein [Ancrocorticia sp.]